MSTLVACCGYIFQRAENPQDKQGTDIIISTPEGKNDGEIGRLTAQVKCTSQIRFDKGDCLVYPLPTKNYNELIKRSLDPRILILILVPDNVDKWIDVSSASQETLIRKWALLGLRCKLYNCDTIIGSIIRL